ncbi:outer membrane protein [Halobacteroides halobius DSM 5150]|uniref:Outer membrane protein n=1 Tax=Halobacteroides halobius (strain ATCC 35273 / DSM 5150 / MD-1) TaxID=748449 RepID=L0K992_HALHC|nr:TolC family protein [Halobacteroides halobius]AGB41837.1 outer membrane protein [Halobacteroides halobius DSM 5150]
MILVQRSKVLSWIIIMGILLSFSLVSRAEEIYFQQAIKWGTKHNSALRDLRYKVNNLKRQLIKLKAKMAWQLNLAGHVNYSRETITELNQLGALDDEIERRKKFIFNLEGTKSFIWGLELNPKLTLGQDKLVSNSFKFTNLEKKLDLKLSFSQKLYPQLPSELRQEYYFLQTDLQKAKIELKWQRELKKIDWITKYLNLLRIKHKQDIFFNNYKLAKQNLEQIKEQKEIKEAGPRKVLAAQIKAQEAKITLVKIKNKFKQIKRNWRQELGYKKSKKILLNITPWLKKLKHKVKDFNVEKIKKSKLVKKAKTEVPKIKYNLVQRKLVSKKLKWERAKAKPKVEFTGNYNYQSADWQVGVNINYNLFDSGYQKLAKKDYQDQLVNLKKDYQSLVADLGVQVKDLLEQLLQIKLQLQEKKTVLEKLRLETALFKKQLQAGGITADKFKEKRNELKLVKIDVKMIRDKILANKLKLMHLTGSLNLN